MHPHAPEALLRVDLLPDQSIKVVSVQRAGPNDADGGFGTVIYEGPMSVASDIKCPCCDQDWVCYCKRCGTFSCLTKDAKTTICPGCGNEANLVPMDIFKVEVAPERAGGGSGQQALPGGKQQQITSDRRTPVVYNPNIKF
jgi:hypothetical protein